MEVLGKDGFGNEMKEFHGMYKNKKYTFMIRKKGMMYPIDIKIGLKWNETFGEFRIKEKEKMNLGYKCEELDSCIIYEIEKQEEEEEEEGKDTLKE
jgi:hypothetical protein